MVFWILYMCFFIFIFPLFFSFSGEFKVSINSEFHHLKSITLAIAILIWIIFFYLLYTRLLRNPRKLLKKAEDLLKYGVLTSAYILDRQLLSVDENGEDIEITVEFINLKDTVVTTQINIFDSKPSEERYLIGKEIKIRLNQESNALGFLPDKVDVSLRISKWIGISSILFTLIYAIISLKYYGLGYESIEFLSFIHP